MQDPTKTKRILIASIYVTIFVTIGIILYYLAAPDATCTDGKKNQAEKGIDCGGPCSPCKEVKVGKDLNIAEQAFVNGGNSTYDVMLKLQNPNNNIGASDFQYSVALKDSSGNVVSQKDGASFVLPAETKYLLVMGLPVEQGKTPVSLDVKLTDYDWSELKASARPQLNIYSKQLNALPTGVGNEAEGTVRNESTYDLDKVIINVVLRDERGKVIGLNSTERNNVRSKEDRYFKVTWPYALSGNVANVEMEAQSNIYIIND